MANPRQRRKAKSGTAKVKQSRRQNDRQRKIIVQGPPELVKQWDTHKTALQNCARLGIAARNPLALRQSGGLEKEIVPLKDLDKDDAEEEDSDSDSDEDSAPGPSNAASTSTSTASTVTKRKSGKFTSKDIPKGFARIERDAQGNVLRVIMSAFDEPAEEEQQEGEDEEDEEDEAEQDTPWGKPLNDEKHEKAMQKNAQPVLAKNEAIRNLEQQTASQNAIKASTTRFASPAELQVLRALVQKYGEDTSAMSRDLKLNRDQRTAGQLGKALKRCGGAQALLA